MKRRRYWIAYDLGIRGSYDDLYAWLDRKKALECGENFATFLSDRKRSEIVNELSETLRNEKHARIYLIDLQNGGKFVLGKRKVAPWIGYALVSVESGEEK